MRTEISQWEMYSVILKSGSILYLNMLFSIKTLLTELKKYDTQTCKCVKYNLIILYMKTRINREPSMYVSMHEISIYVRYSIVSQIRWARHIKNKSPWKNSIVYEI